MRHHQLDTGWTLRVVEPAPGAPADLAGRAVPASVPGCVHTDLLGAGLVPDPYLDRNELGLEWIGRSTWSYSTTFAADPAGGERSDLVFEGLDTVAEVRVNGTVVARTANMNRTYRVDVRDALRAGDNELTVEFGSAWDYADARAAELGARPAAVDGPFNMIRKMACNFGWDWGPALVTAGIWRPARLESWQGARISSVRPLVDVRADGTGVATVHVGVEWAEPGSGAPLELAAEVAGVRATARVAPDQAGAVLTLEVPDVERWWPHTHGGQARYPLAVTLAAADRPAEQPLDRWQRRIGFRTVELDTTPDEQGSRFALVVNGRAVFARGADWIPDDCFPSRVGPGRYRERVAQAVGAHVDLLRVWGGGTYESDAFYDACDEAGVLVWQDFLFACAAYPEEEPFATEVAAEARDNVARLSAHPSLAVWNGNNENIWGFHAWDWQAPLDGRTWGKGFYYDLLPGIVAELDPTRPYIPGSPSSATFEEDPNDDRSGCVHEWEVWNRLDYAHYRDRRPRFVSEFGFQGPPTWATIRRAVSDEVLTADSPNLLHHQKAEHGQGKLARGMAPHLPEPRPGEHGFDDWLWLTQLNQARAVAFGIEHFRSLAPSCAGSVVWQLNDCWPVTSWAAVDGDGRRKPLWYAIAHAYADRLLTVQPRDGGLALVAVNDTDRTWNGSARVSRCGFDGSREQSLDLELAVPPGGVLTAALPDPVATPGDPAAEILIATATALDGRVPRRALWTFAEDRDLALPGPEVETRVEQVEGGAVLSVTARTFVRDLAVFVDRLQPDAVVDDMLLTLFPGETAVLRVTGLAHPDPIALGTGPVLRSVADQHVRVAVGAA